MSIPLRGQGSPLPLDFPYRGQWILEGRMFLYASDEIRNVDPGAPQFTVHVNKMQADWSFGFDSAQLASALEITIAELFEANHRQRLTLEKIEADTPDGEAPRMKRYTFRVGDHEGMLTIESPTFFGSA